MEPIGYAVYDPRSGQFGVVHNHAEQARIQADRMNEAMKPEFQNWVAVALVPIEEG